MKTMRPYVTITLQLKYYDPIVQPRACLSCGFTSVIKIKQIKPLISVTSLWISRELLSAIVLSFLSPGFTHSLPLSSDHASTLITLRVLGTWQVLGARHGQE